MMRRWVAALCCATAMGMIACGGGGGDGGGNDGGGVQLDEASSYFMTDLEGRQYRVQYGTKIDDPLRATAPGVNYSANYKVDATGQGYLTTTIDPPWSRGLLSMFGPIRVLGLDIGGVRKPYVVAIDLVTQLSELEGVGFNVLGSRANADGKAIDAYAGSARFTGGKLQLCLPDTPTPFDQCPVARLTSFDATLIGTEIQLVSPGRTLRLRAARSGDGPLLISSSRDAATGASEFWIGLPDTAQYSFGEALLTETALGDANGHSTAVLAGIDHDSAGNPRITPSKAAIPQAAFMRLSATGNLGICGVAATLMPSAQPGLFQGTLNGDWLPGAYADGDWVKAKSCFAGPVYHAQTSNVAVSLGARGGALMGRWMIITR